MALRITRFDEEEGTVLQIDGRLEAETLGELERAREGAGAALVLDLRGVLWLDEQARKALRRLVDDGARVRAASPFIALLLANEQSSENKDVSE